MSRETKTETFPASMKLAELEETVRRKVKYHGEDGRPGCGTSHINVIDGICGTYDEAQSKLESAAHANHQSYDGYAVKYRQDWKVPMSASASKLVERIQAENAALTAYASEHLPSKAKAEFVGCPACGSKLRREKLGTRTACPVCLADMRSKTTRETIARKQAKIAELQKQLSRAREKDSEKAEVAWLVYYQWHC